MSPVASVIDSAFPTLEKRESIILISEPCSDTDIPVGAFKFGGNPDMPKEMASMLKSAPENTIFVGQINFAEVKPHDHLSLLPSDGTLVLFFQQIGAGEPTGLSYFYEKGTKLERLALPSNVETSESRRFSFEKWVTVPFLLDQEDAAKIAEPDEDYDDVSDKYEELNNELDGEFLKRFYPEHDNLSSKTPWHQIYGFHRDIQCTGRRPGGKEKWQLLLQVDTDDRSNMCWGDNGQLYYWIREEDLRNKDFSKLEMEFYCY